MKFEITQLKKKNQKIQIEITKANKPDIIWVKVKRNGNDLYGTDLQDFISEKTGHKCKFWTFLITDESIMFSYRIIQ